MRFSPEVRFMERPKQVAWHRANWPAYLACVLAFVGLVWSVLSGFDPHGSQNAASDFKTLYASAWCFRHGIDGYQFSNLAQVFRANGVVEPRSWYGHSPVYPPFTLALLWPVTWLPMVPASYVWIIASATCMGVATAALIRRAGEAFSLPLPLKVLLAGIVAASPLLEIGLELANVSVISAALCIFAVATPRNLDPWIKAAALTAALLLKPHIALWIVLATLFTFASGERRIFWRTCGLMVAFLCLFAIVGLFHHFFFTQFASYREIVLSELGSGSMSPGNRDVMEVLVQMTPISVLLGYWLWQHPAATLLGSGIVLVLGSALAWACWKMRSTDGSHLLYIAAAWSAFGLVATYHREADATIMVVILPVVLARLGRNVKDAWGWCVMAALIIGSFGPSAISLHFYTDPAPVSSGFRFMLLRQASIASAFLALLLIGRAVVEARTSRRLVPRFGHNPQAPASQQIYLNMRSLLTRGVESHTTEPDRDGDLRPTPS